MRLPQIWDDWVTYDDKGISGLKPDAPDDVKKAFDDWQKEQEALEMKHTKI